MSAIWLLQGYLYGSRQEGTSAMPLTVTLEEAAGWFEQTTMLHFEWDGSFIGAGPEGYQFSGTLFDNGKQLQYVELHARCETPQARQPLHQLVGSVLRMLASDSQKKLPDATNGWGQLDESLSLLRLPGQKWQNLQNLEHELLGFLDENSLTKRAN